VNLQADTYDALTLPSGRFVEVPKVRPAFAIWRGHVPTDTYGHKPLLDFDGRMAFAELAILWTLERSDWSGVWVDTYRKKYRRDYWGIPPIPALPPGPQALLNEIWELRDGRRRGTWDVFCWRNDEYLFAESKWKDHDQIRLAQLQWLEAALRVGLPLSSFLIVEWSIAAAAR
jgi:hypothetical protein